MEVCLFPSLGGEHAVSLVMRYMTKSASIRNTECSRSRITREGSYDREKPETALDWMALFGELPSGYAGNSIGISEVTGAEAPSQHYWDITTWKFTYRGGLDVSKLINSVVVIFIAIATLNAAGEERRVISPDKGPLKDPSTAPVGDVLDSVMQTFDGERLTKARAKQIVEAAGFTFLDFHRCAFPTDDCAIFDVQGSRGVGFQYLVSSERCRHVGDPVLTHGEPAPSPSVPAAREMSPNATSGRRSDDSIVRQPIDGKDAGENLPHCFAGYTAFVRARQHNTLFADHTGSSMSLSNYYQIVQNGRWTDVASMTASAWRLREWGHGTSHVGWAHDIRDANDNLLAGDAYEVDVIALTGANGETKQEACGRRRDGLVKDQLLVNAKKFASCKKAPFPDNGSITVGGSVEVVDVQASLGKNNDVCANDQQVMDRRADTVGQALYDDCMLYPGHYFPADFTPLGPSDILGNLPTFEPSFQTATGKPELCFDHTERVTTKMGNGWECDVDISFQNCKADERGKCQCTSTLATGGSSTCSGPVN